MTRGLHRVQQDKDGPVALAVAILTGSANLRGAACTRNPRLFDPDVSASALGFTSHRDREKAVEATCVGCPARGACWAWASELPSMRITGPTAATSGVKSVMRPRRPRPPRTATPEDPADVPDPPRPARRRGARSRGRPSIHRNR